MSKGNVPVCPDCGAEMVKEEWFMERPPHYCVCVAWFCECKTDEQRERIISNKEPRWFWGLQG